MTRALVLQAAVRVSHFNIRHTTRAKMGSPTPKRPAPTLVPRWQMTLKGPRKQLFLLPLTHYANQGGHGTMTEHECRQTSKISSRSHSVCTRPTAAYLHPTTSDSTEAAIPSSLTQCVSMELICKSCGQQTSFEIKANKLYPHTTPHIARQSWIAKTLTACSY